MNWVKLIVLVFAGLVLFLGRNSFLKNIYTRTGLIIVALFLFIYSDYLIQQIVKFVNPADAIKINSSQTINYSSPDSSQYNFETQDSLSNPSVTTEYPDTIFNINSVKIHFREELIAPPENIYSYPTTLAMLDILDETDSVIQKIELEINAISSPIETNDSYNILGDRGITLDYNFDGYDDIVLRFGNGSNNHAVNGYFYIYLFNPVTKQFDKYDKELNNPVPDPKNKRVELDNIYSTAYPHTLTEICE